MIFFLVVFFIGNQPHAKAYLEYTGACEWALSNPSKNPIVFGLKSESIQTRVYRSGLENSPWTFDMHGEEMSDRTFPVMQEMVCKKTRIYPPTPKAYYLTTIEESR